MAAQFAIPNSTITITQALSPWIIDKIVYVQSGQTLVIEPGVELICKADILYSQGNGFAVFDTSRIIANGTAGSPITMHPELPGNTKSVWGIAFNPGTSGQLEYVTIDYAAANPGIQCASGTSVSMKHCNVRYSSRVALAVNATYAASTSLYLDDCQFIGCLQFPSAYDRAAIQIGFPGSTGGWPATVTFKSTTPGLSKVMDTGPSGNRKVGVLITQGRYDIGPVHVGIEGVQFSGNKYGVELAGKSDARLSANSFLGNQLAAIYSNITAVMFSRFGIAGDGTVSSNTYSGNGWDGIDVPGGTINPDIALLPGAGTYVLRGDGSSYMRVASLQAWKDQVVNVEKGTRIAMPPTVWGNMGAYTGGVLRFNGGPLPGEEIILTSANPAGSKNPGDWGGLYANTNSTLEIAHTTIEYAGIQVSVDRGAHVSITDSTIRKGGRYGLLVNYEAPSYISPPGQSYDTQVYVSDSTLSENQQSPYYAEVPEGTIAIRNNDAGLLACTIQNSMIEKSGPTNGGLAGTFPGIDLQGPTIATDVTIHGNTFSLNGTGIDFQGDGLSQAKITCNRFIDNAVGIYMRAASNTSQIMFNSFGDSTPRNTMNLFGGTPDLISAPKNWWGIAPAAGDSPSVIKTKLRLSGNVDPVPWLTAEFVQIDPVLTTVDPRFVGPILDDTGAVLTAVFDRAVDPGQTTFEIRRLSDGAKIPINGEFYPDNLGWLGDVTGLLDGAYELWVIKPVSCSGSKSVGDTLVKAFVSPLVDARPPTLTANVLGPRVVVGGVAFVSPFTAVAIQAVDLSGIALLTMKIDNGTAVPISSGTLTPFSGLSESPHTINVVATDASPNANTSQVSFSGRVDGTAPSVIFGPFDTMKQFTVGAVTYVNASAPFGIVVNDGTGAGVDLIAGLYLSRDNGVEYSAVPASFMPGPAEGPVVLKVKAIDQVGNTGYTSSLAYTVDGTSPVSTISMAGVSQIGGGNFVQAPWTFTIGSTDGGVGVDSSALQVTDGGVGPIPHAGSAYTLTGPVGEHFVHFHSADLVGNVEADKVLDVILVAAQPAPPSPIAVQILTTTSARLTWSPPADTRGILRYQVNPVIGGVEQNPPLIVASTAAPSLQVDNLDLGVSVSYVVRTVDIFNQVSGPSSVVTVTTSVQPPVIVAPGGGALFQTYLVTFVIQGEPGTSITISRNGMVPFGPFLIPAGGSISKALDLTSWGEGLFNLNVTAEKNGSVSAPAVQPMTIDVMPGTPVTKDVLGLDTRVQLRWYRNPEPDIDHYEIYRNGGPAVYATVPQPVAGPGQPVDENGSPVVILTDLALTDGLTYSYRIVAVDYFGHHSGSTAIMQATPVAGPEWAQ